MKKIALAVAAALTAAAPAAFAQQYDRNEPYRNGPSAPSYSDRYDNRDNRDWRVDEGHDYRNSSQSSRDWRNRSDDYGRVLEARPLYAAGNAREECWNTRSNRYEEPRTSRESHVGAGTAIGAIAGGVAGHQVGSGNGNTLATVGGAVLGGLLGHHVENRGTNDEPDFDRSRCRVLAQNGSNALGYDVRYDYKGREYVARLDHDPGPYVKLGRDVSTDGTPMDAGGNGARPGWYSGG
jgi:uncharacterized protein YcfJ